MVPMGSTRSFRVAGMFAGIGGIELGLSRAGHETTLLCENDPFARAVLEARFPGVPVVGDIKELKRLPKGTNMIAGGFPCQDLSQAGDTKGIGGSRSGLVDEVFRLAESHDIPWLLLENVPFMLRLSKGAAMNHIVRRLEGLGYRWAYRVMDTRAFGLPQRRERVYLLASKVEDPAPILFHGNVEPDLETDHTGQACGFYWTEGVRGLGWAISAVPTLKGGSTVGIASPPAIWMPDGRIVTPDIRDAERLQGFRSDWTKPAEGVGRKSFRWKLVGNAVSVPVARWIGDRLAMSGGTVKWDGHDGIVSGSWPTAAFESDGCAFAVDISKWPVHRKQANLSDFLRYEPKELSLRATTGFSKRLASGTLRAPEAFRLALKHHIERMGANVTH
ncbi:putative BsuMI modification methylase subunit YdiP [Planctomycetes bacterium Poly30]|uniref:Cytosine-specific methyltransferase n=1 Tax=Saltatorellus ferox TaxID=2528018 RepID=A0A518ENE6_9BACT|nr:putative BsuMI modification methylase subunit YdiP [Planctomycetes bacterium Poly30]